MAELLECLICGCQTVRSGMANHLKSKHPIDYKDFPMNKLVKSLGKISYKDFREGRKPKK